MRKLVLLAVLLGAAGCAATPRAPDAISRGQAIAEANCAACHAVGLTGRSPAPEAPPFRTLSRNYRVESLEEALAEGISVGHPAMPNFEFEPREVNALIAYLRSIQTTER